MVFEWTQARGQCLWGVAGIDRQCGLGDHCAGIQFRDDEMHTASVLMVASIQCAGMGVQPFVFRKQRGVDVQQPAVKSVDEGSVEDAHVTGADYPIGSAAGDGGGQRRIMGGAGWKIAGVGAPA